MSNLGTEDEVIDSSLELTNILKQLKIMNIHLEAITNIEIDLQEID